MESSIVEILQEIKNLTTKVEKVDSKIDTLDEKVSRLEKEVSKDFQGLKKEVRYLSTKVEVTGSVLVEMVGVLDKLNTNSIRAEEQIKRLFDRHPRID
ncbi:hypothetical protein SteCoe_39715 [Stentor coeruleus]|uniref:Uncharacterized protein n=1 Tax=Stentor coeruleus TaxID=5963 RepID=A0A1R2AKH5_9CILI|nr:hypothetical protein SteCoe_39715 [Stentor coeruleus]